MGIVDSLSMPSAVRTVTIRSSPLPTEVCRIDLDRRACAWRSARFAGLIALWPEQVAGGMFASRTPTFLRKWLVPGAARAQSRALMTRDVELFVRCTGGTSCCLHSRQWQATFAALARSPRADFLWSRFRAHAFSAESDRQRLFDAEDVGIAARLARKTKRSQRDDRIVEAPARSSGTSTDQYTVR